MYAAFLRSEYYDSSDFSAAIPTPRLSHSAVWYPYCLDAIK